MVKNKKTVILCSDIAFRATSGPQNADEHSITVFLFPLTYSLGFEKK